MIRRELANKEFNSNDTRGPKSVSAFIVKLSELTPRLIIKQMTLLAKQLDSEVQRFLIPFSRLILTISAVIYPPMRCDRGLRESCNRPEQARGTK